MINESTQYFYSSTTIIQGVLNSKNKFIKKHLISIAHRKNC
jgi:hypothetical protein